MEGSKKIEHEIGGLNNDAFRFGLQGVKSDIVGSHPLESAFQSAIVREDNMKRKILANTYGSAFPVKQELDRKILSRFQRPPGLIPSSMLGLESLTGALDDFGFEDYLQDAHDTETMRILTCTTEWKFVLGSQRDRFILVSYKGGCEHSNLS